MPWTKSGSTPPAILPFISLGFDYSESKLSGGNAFGDCPFCGGTDKFYVNTGTTQWDCKAGSCLRRGNIYSFLNQWYAEHLKKRSDLLMDVLAKERKLPKLTLEYAGILTYDSKWWLPIRNLEGHIINLRSYQAGQALKSLPTLESALFGAEELSLEDRAYEPVYICEGEWDTIAMRWLLERSGEEGIAIGAPGSGVWKMPWSQWLRGRDVVLCYDNDTAGIKGINRVAKSLSSMGVNLGVVVWPANLPVGYDVRDLATSGMGFHELQILIADYQEAISQAGVSTIPGYTPPESEQLSVRPGPPRKVTFEKVLEEFSKHLYMTDDMQTCLKLILAVVLSTDIEGDPLWLHIVSPPGTAKTELLLPLSVNPRCHFASTVTAHSLVSGYLSQNGEDPSLIPKLNGKTFVLKDYTEVLNLPRSFRDEIYATFRGAYDGLVQKSFGNGVVREYQVKFNMLTGVTHAIFGERGASLGERFLVFHLVKGVAFDAKAAIRAAINNVGEEKTVRAELATVISDFIEYTAMNHEVTKIPAHIVDKIIPLASLVGMLRASVEWGDQGYGDKLLYRPQHEAGTRLAKQLAKMMMGLAKITGEIGESEYRILVRVAMDTCIGLHLELLNFLIKKPNSGLEEITAEMGVPNSTTHGIIENMILLGVVSRNKLPSKSNDGRGRPKIVYEASAVFKGYWMTAELDKIFSGLSGPELDYYSGKMRKEQVYETV